MRSISLVYSIGHSNSSTTMRRDLIFCGYFLLDSILGTPENVDVRISTRPDPAINEPTSPMKRINMCMPPSLGKSLANMS